MEAMHIDNWLEETLGNAMGEIAEQVESDFDTTGNIELIPHESFPGFFPFTNGGVEFMASMRLEDVECSGTYPNNKAVEKELNRAIEYNYTESRRQFISDHRVQLEKIFTIKELNDNSEDVNYHTLYNHKEGKLAEELSEMEHAWMTEDVFFIQHRFMFFSKDNTRNITGEDEIYFYSGVNTDYNYGRDKGLMDCYEKTVKVGDLTPNKVNEIVKQMLDAV